MEEIITIDGSFGEGGGQILRTSLSVSMLKGIPIKITNIRAGRKKPGLMRQHLISVRAAARVCNGKVKGDELNSQEISFYPGPIVGGKFQFTISTAGSTTLVCQTILPALLVADSASEIIFEGGTHNGMSPSLTFLMESFLPVLASMGVKYDIEIERYGFFPVGGGRWKLNVEPCQKLKPFKLTSAPQWHALRGTAVVSNKLPRSIGAREIRKLLGSSLRKKYSIESEVRHVQSPGPGNTVHISAESHGLRSMVETVGEKNLRAEDVAKNAVKRFQQFQALEVMVEEHLADQILLYMTLSKEGSFTTCKPSLHTNTNIKVLETLMDINFKIEEITKQTYMICLNQNRNELFESNSEG